MSWFYTLNWHVDIVVLFEDWKGVHKSLKITTLLCWGTRQYILSVNVSSINLHLPVVVVAGTLSQFLNKQYIIISEFIIVRNCCIKEIQGYRFNLKKKKIPNIFVQFLLIVTDLVNICLLLKVYLGTKSTFQPLFNTIT